MPLIENITNIEVSNDITGSNFLKLYIFKENLIQLLLISNNIWNIINTTKSTTNIYNLFIISFDETNIKLDVRSTIEFAGFNGIYKNLDKIFIQKSNYYENYEKGFVSFNVIGYNLGGVWHSISEYYKNQNYDKLMFIAGFKGNIITKPDVKKILFKLKMVPGGQTEHENIRIENLIYFSNKKNYFGYTNDTKNEITCFPLIRPYSDITVTTKLENIENNGQMLFFENNTSFIIPSVSLNQKITIKNISIRTMRITEDIGENLQLKFYTLGSNQTLYNLMYGYNNNNYNFKFNIISLKFVTNRNLQKQDSDQSDNKILINKHTNNVSLVEEGSDFSNNRFDWGTQLPLFTTHSYLEQRVVGITKEELNNFKYKDLNYKILVQNKNSSIINIYIQNYSSMAVPELLQNTSNFGKVDLSNNILQIIPKAKSNMDGKKAFIGYKIMETNYSIFKNLIIPDSYIEIAGVEPNIDKVLINLNKDTGSKPLYSTQIKIGAVDNDYYNNIRIPDKGTEISGKNPYISSIKQVLNLNYKVYVSNNNIRFERLNNNDQSILDLSGSSLNLSNDNPTFTALEDENYIFDVSDESNKGFTIKFFKDIDGKVEYLDDQGFSYAKYSRNHDPGESGSFIQITTPEKKTVADGKFYYFLIKKNYINNQPTGKGTINILGRKTLYHGEITVEKIDKGPDSGILTYSNELGKFYDPLSIKPRITVDLSFNNATNFNYFNNYEYQNKDISGQVDISSSNVKSFTGDNIVCFSKTLDQYNYNFIFTNTNLIHGKIKIGFSTIYNSDLFTKKNNGSNYNENSTVNNESVNNQSVNSLDEFERFLKKIPFDLSNVELNGITNNKNDTNYIVYNSKNFDANMNKTEFLIKYDPETSNGFVSNDRFSTGDLSDCSQNIFLAAHVYDPYTYMALLIIEEDSFGISRFEKITNSDVEISSSSLSSSNLVSTYDSTGTTVTSLNFAFVRKKFNFKADISGISRNDDIFLFEPLDYSNNILNHDLNYNEYVVGMFDTSSNNFDKISMCKIKLKQTKPFFINTFNSSIVVDNYAITSKWVSGTDFGLFETKPRDLVSKYKDMSINASNNAPNISLNNFKLPLFDSNTYNEFTVEIEYFKCWDNNPDAKITYRINRKDSSGNLTEYDTLTNVVIPQSDNRFNPHGEIVMNIDVDGFINIMNLSSGPNFIGENLNNKRNAYKVSYQIENYITNNVLNEISTTNNLYNFNTQISTTQQGKTILNMKYLNIPLKLRENDPSKNYFNTFLNRNSMDVSLNTLINKQNPIKLGSLLYQDTDLSSSQLSYTGIGYINYNTQEFNGNFYDPSGAYSNLSGTPINFNVIDVKTITDLNSIITNEKDIKLDWNFINDNLSVAIKFKVYRSQNPTNKEYILIGTTTNKYYYDSKAIPYLTVDYRVESIAVWGDVELVTGNKEITNFICQNNTFEYGRYNNTTKNSKLYQPINKSCKKIGMLGIATTGNLFPNSQVLTKSQIYSTLSRAKFRPFR